MPETTRVSILNKETIIVGAGMTKAIAKEITSIATWSAFVFVSDSNVAPLHLGPLMEAFQELSSARLLQFIIKPGEVHKTRETKASVEDFMLSQACTRDTCLIALGGGVIGDLVGRCFD